MSMSLASAKSILLSDYKDILLAHEDEYCLSKGSKCQEIAREVIEEIFSQGKSKLREDIMKGLKSTSQFFHQFGLRKFRIGMVTTRMSHWRKNLP